MEVEVVAGVTVKQVCCSSKGLEVGCQHPHLVTHNCLIFQCLLLAFGGTFAHVYRYTRVYTHISPCVQTLR